MTQNDRLRRFKDSSETASVKAPSLLRTEPKKLEGVYSEFITVEDRGEQGLLVLSLRNSRQESVSIPVSEIHRPSNLDILLNGNGRLLAGLEEELHEIQNVRRLTLKPNETKFVRIQITNYSQFHEVAQRNGGIVTLKHLAFEGNPQVFRFTVIESDSRDGSSGTHDSPQSKEMHQEKEKVSDKS